MWVSEKTSLAEILGDFQERFNTNERAKKLVKGWDRFILLDSMDDDERYALIVEDQDLTEVRAVDDYDEEAEDLVHLQADKEVLESIFAGRYNPATALVDGALAVFSDERDKVKLEALAMVIWRLG